MNILKNVSVLGKIEIVGGIMLCIFMVASAILDKNPQSLLFVPIGLPAIAIGLNHTKD